MDTAAKERLILAMWDDYEREGLSAILRWASEDAMIALHREAP
jgi:hypothetical protein